MSKIKPAVNELFGDDTDDEHGPEDGIHHRQSSDSASVLPPAAAHIDSKTKEVADKLAEFVSKHGRHYEELTREKNPGNTPFKFLWNKASKEYKYYEAKLNSLLQASGLDTGGQSPRRSAQQHDNSRYGNHSSQGRRHNDHAQDYKDRSYDRPSNSHDRYDRSRHDRGRAGRETGHSGDQEDRYSSRYSDRDHTRHGHYQADTAEYRGDYHSNSRHQQTSGSTPHAARDTSAHQQYSSHSRDTQHQRLGSSSSEYEPASKRTRWEAGSQHASSGQGTHTSNAPATAAEAGGDNTLSAMELYMKRLEEQAKQKREDEEEEERRRRTSQPLLKETAFDRRKVVAVFKEDGRRGHHMDDFIPKEELAKFMAKCGDTNLQQKVEAEAAIGSDNIGHKLLQKMGWKEGQGIGAKSDGRTVPVAAVKQDNLGLGAQAHEAVTETDDPFEQYRKRMMLGYKYRPNPLGNPRKAYY